MDFIERLVHVTPDGGDGSLEAVYVVFGIVCAGTVLFRGAVVSAVRNIASKFARRV